MVRPYYGSRIEKCILNLLENFFRLPCIVSEGTIKAAEAERTSVVLSRFDQACYYTVRLARHARWYSSGMKVIGIVWRPASQEELCWWPCQRTLKWHWSSRCQPRRKLSDGSISVGQAPEITDHKMSFCFCCAFTCLLLGSCSGIWNGVNGCGEPHCLDVLCLSHQNILFYWALLPVCGLSLKMILPMLYYLIDNNDEKLCFKY